MEKQNQLIMLALKTIKVSYIYFVEEQKYKMIISNGYKPENIIKNISRLDPSKRFIENETLIFFDELQKFPDIATSLKFFKIQGKYDDTK